MKKQDKPVKQKKHYLRKFIKDIKMIRWPKGNVLVKSFLIVVVFAIIFTLAVFAIIFLINLSLSGMGVN